MKVSFELNFRLIARLVLGLILCWGALSKLANLQEAYASLLAYHLPLPLMLLRPAAAVLPWLELLTGLLLLTHTRIRAASAWATLLFAIFFFSTAQAWARGLNISCGCLDLRLLGIDSGSTAAGILESVQFACLRALVLGALALDLYRNTDRK